MTPTGTQITDMLLGFVPTDGIDASAGQSTPALDSDKSLFGDLLGGLLHSRLTSGTLASSKGEQPWIVTAGDILRPRISGEAISVTNGSRAILPSPHGPVGAVATNNAEVVDPKITTLPFDAMPYRAKETAIVDGELNPVAGPLIDDSESVIAHDMKAGTTSGPADRAVEKLGAFLPIVGTISTRQLMNIVETSNSMMEPGRYQITDSRFADGTVTMQVVASDDLSRTFKVSIPLTEFQEAISRNGADNPISGRVPLDGLNRPMATIEQFVSSLNLKELEVKPEVPSIDIKSRAIPVEEPTSFVITAEKAGQHLSMRVRVHRSRIQVKVDSPRQGLDDSVRSTVVIPAKNVNVVDSGTTLVTVPRQNLLFDPEQTIRFGKPAGFAPGNSAETSTDEGLAGKNVNTPALSLLDESANKTDSGASGRVVYSARLSLPDDLATRQQISARSIMLKIEPEHLGPARLHLVMRNDQLVAQVVVNSIHAKAAIEGGLEDLARQLNQANIDVESIDVSVAGDREESNQNAHRTFWGHRAKSLSGRQVDPGSTENDAISSNRYVPPPIYIGADGVNILA